MQGLVSVAPGFTLDARQQTVLESMPFISGATLAGVTLVGGDVKKKANTASGCVRPEVFWDARFSIAVDSSSDTATARVKAPCSHCGSAWQLYLLWSAAEVYQTLLCTGARVGEVYSGSVIVCWADC